jgi:CDP-glucose 4,6-dehydratase
MELRQGPVEDLVTPGQPFGGTFSGTRVLVTGHTGFKGAWLTEWLLQLGARVGGFSLNVPTRPALSESLYWGGRIQEWTGDICDRAAIQKAILEFQPAFIFHLAAQPLVRTSYAEPVATFQTNVIGTLQVLDAARSLTSPCTILGITTDKCYENREWLHAYREEDSMGGYDPYSASKGCAELVTSAYRRSYFQASGDQWIASARAGNVIGGGDWAKDRIVPDIFRALGSGEAIPVRNKLATRPWQHVLEPISGYLWLASNLTSSKLARFPNSELATGFNFGPSLASNRTVAEVVEAVLELVPGKWVDRSDPDALHEASKLNLATDKAFHMLGWSPTWGFEETIAKTVAWYKEKPTEKTAQEITSAQIEEYEQQASATHKSWAIKH